MRSSTPTLCIHVDQTKLKLLTPCADNPGVEVRALVTSIDKARSVLHCKSCDASEGIFLGDVTNQSTLADAFVGADAVACAVGLSGNETKDLMSAVEWKGVEHQVAELTKQLHATQPVGSLFFALVSSMGTTNPSPPPYEGGADLFWKLQAESFLMSSGVGYAIVKPCGLVDAAGGKTSLFVGHDDSILSPLFHSIPRADVASVIVEAVVSSHNKYPTTGLRMDLCSKPGKATTDYAALLESAKYPWQRSS